MRALLEALPLSILRNLALVGLWPSRAEYRARSPCGRKTLFFRVEAINLIVSNAGVFHITLYVVEREPTHQNF
jgi:hypothetical protein